MNLSSWEPGKTGEESTYYVTNADNLLECRQTVTGGLCSKNSLTELSHDAYDKAGEELAVTPKADTSGSTFAYNAARETKAITPSGESEQALAYGGTGQGDLVEVGSATLQNSLLGLTREAASGGTSYFARTPNGMLVDQRTPSGSFNPLLDAQGDVIALVSSSGKVERTFQYGPYGENVESGGEQTVPFHFDFQGGYRMPGGNTGKGKSKVSNGLYHFGQRYYDPTVGRWTQPDPRGGGYGFVSEDPINLSDRSGLFSPEEGWDFAEGQAKKLYHKAVKLVKYAIDKQNERWGFKGPYRGSEVATSCEVAGAVTLVQPIGGAFAKFVVSAAIYNNC